MTSILNPQRNGNNHRSASSRIRPPGSFPHSTDPSPVSGTPCPPSPPSIFLETPLGTLTKPAIYNPLYCPNCRHPLFEASAAMSRRPLPHTITPIIKPGQLAHPAGPSAGTKTESASCISSQNVNSVLASNPISGGNFIIFRRKQRVAAAVVPKPPAAAAAAAASAAAAADEDYAHLDDPTSAAGPSGSTLGTAVLSGATPHTQTYDVVSGHGYVITSTGSVLYVGRERALESVFVRCWTADKGALQKIEPLRGSRREYRFCLFGPGNHTSFFRTFDEFNGRGSWRRLLGEAPERGVVERATHAVFMELPEVVAQMVALGIPPAELAKCLKQGDYGTLRLEFTPTEWTTPEQREEIAGLPVAGGRNRAKAWKSGWWYTARKGMGVWLS
ncbi:hypothetical protein FN846DRAFT_1021591 [Sphaerosporella brunnea]|uniref:Uncharacterized protein n=1 Tax=Sphaerosporella brunnea TaxID=1250544 RepID=A0A5J5EY39_9PEZI|nr:hypothetical protein FN846DRAFT_1021591 [Sphaerosporella brunnea]